ncbi:hypothetical protein A2U01_0005943 [Trifolium medium]|uniref:Uncharacterized protein n=1 Tax=Trifolium medium TaxID=97028 RepID=A0A392MCT4_9FABA|nr:hypothetical protein [Trifolium medium]
MIVFLRPHFYLLRLDWNLILRSRCAEYEIRKLQEPTFSGSKYLEIKEITTINDEGQDERRKCKKQSLPWYASSIECIPS